MALRVLTKLAAVEAGPAVQMVIVDLAMAPAAFVVAAFVVAKTDAVTAALVAPWASAAREA
jgi:hypothetical protein